MLPTHFYEFVKSSSVTNFTKISRLHFRSNDLIFSAATAQPQEEILVSFQFGCFL